MSVKKTDKRILHSKRFIKEGLIELMKTKTIDKISVLELCKTADINRNTFYAHYSTPEEVLNELEDETAEELLGILSSNPVKKRILESLRYIKEHQNIYGVLISNRSSRFNQKMSALTTEFMISFYKEAGMDFTQTQKHRLQFTNGGMMGVIDAWVKEGCTYPVESLDSEITEFLNI